MTLKSNILEDTEVEAYMRDGFIVKNDLLTSRQVEAVKEAFSMMVQKYGPDRNLAEVVSGDGGKIAGGALIKRRDHPFFFQLEAGQEPHVDDPGKLELQVRKFMWFEKEAAIFEEILNPQSLMFQIASELIGDTPLLFQSLALIKPPLIGSTKPWHQDNAYFSVTPLESVCGVWIAVDEATVRNGCMHMLKGQHRVGAFRHEHGRDCEINVRKLDLTTLTPVPLKPGGALFFSGMIPHETPPNRTEERRRALQFHFRGEYSEIVPGPEYDKVFLDKDGLPGSCEAVRRESI